MDTKSNTLDIPVYERINYSRRVVDRVLDEGLIRLVSYCFQWHQSPFPVLEWANVATLKHLLTEEQESYLRWLRRETSPPPRINRLTIIDYRTYDVKFASGQSAEDEAEYFR